MTVTLTINGRRVTAAQVLALFVVDPSVQVGKPELLADAVGSARKG